MYTTDLTGRPALNKSILSAAVLAAGLCLAAGNVMAQQQVPDDALICESGHFYSLNPNGSLTHVDATDPEAVEINPVFSMSGTLYNGLGINKGGSKAYAYERINYSGGWGVRMHTYEPGDTDWKTPGTGVDQFLTHDIDRAYAGAVNPTNNTYYAGFAPVAITGNGSNEWLIYSYDESSSPETLVLAAIVETPGSNGNNGDITFDQQGNLYIVQSTNSTARIFKLGKSDLDGAAGSNVDAELLAEFSTGGKPIQGIADAGEGRLFVGHDNNRLSLYDSADDSVVALKTEDGSDVELRSTDLASCVFDAPVPPAAIAPVPTNAGWMLALLSAMLVGVGGYFGRRKLKL